MWLPRKPDSETRSNFRFNYLTRFENQRCVRPNQHHHSGTTTRRTRWTTLVAGEWDEEWTRAFHTQRYQQPRPMHSDRPRLCSPSSWQNSAARSSHHSTRSAYRYPVREHEPNTESGTHLNVGVVAKELHQVSLDGLGLVENGLSADFQATNVLRRDLELLKEILDR